MILVLIILFVSLYKNNNMDLSNNVWILSLEGTVYLKSEWYPGEVFKVNHKEDINHITAKKQDGTTYLVDMDTTKAMELMDNQWIVTKEIYDNF